MLWKFEEQTYLLDAQSDRTQIQVEINQSTPKLPHALNHVYQEPLGRLEDWRLGRLELKRLHAWSLNACTLGLARL
jgi:hypothetical protein